MPSFKTLDGQTLQYGQEGTYLPEDEKAFILSLDKQVRAADLTDKKQVSTIQSNLNQISKILEFLISSSKRRDITYEVDQKRIRPIDANNQIPDCTKFINHTKWRPKYSFEETMTDLLNYWRDIVSVKGKDFLQR